MIRRQYERTQVYNLSLLLNAKLNTGNADAGTHAPDAALLDLHCDGSSIN
jgi:hypothetical protein